MNSIKQALILLFQFVIFFAQAQNTSEIQTICNQWINQEQLKHASIGICVQDANTGEELLATSPQLSLVPASTLKLLTTAAALEILGPYFRFETQLAYTGEIRNDSLIGNLVIIGGGDPALGSDYFKDHYLTRHFLDSWVKSLKEKNINYIDGDLLTDATVYEDQMIPNTWIWEDLGNYYGAGACGLSVYDNMYKIHLASPATAGLPTQIIATDPVIPDVYFDNQVLSANDHRDQAYVFGSPMESKRTIRGTIPKGEADFTIKASIPNPPYLLASQLKDKLETNRIKLSGEIRAQNETDVSPQVTVLARTASPPLIDIIDVTNHESVNLFAEHMLKHLALLKTGKGSTKEGIKAVADFWEEKGIDTEGLFMADGSGLSRFNAITARQMVGVLTYMRTQSTNGEAFFKSLPTVPNGTLWYFHPENFPNYCLRAKSGSMTRVRCFAGKLETDTGRELLFAVFLNNFSCSQSNAIKAVENLLKELRQITR